MCEAYSGEKVLQDVRLFVHDRCEYRRSVVDIHDVWVGVTSHYQVVHHIHIPQPEMYIVCHFTQQRYLLFSPSKQTRLKKWDKTMQYTNLRLNIYFSSKGQIKSNPQRQISHKLI